MPLAVSLRRIAIPFVALCALSLPALAGVRTMPGEDAVVHQHANAKPLSSEPAKLAGHTARISIAPTEDGTPSLHHAAAPCSTSTRELSRTELGELAKHAAVPVQDHRGEHHPRAAANASSVRPHRPDSHRSKYGLRNSPATPGMGTLLRFGASAGQEISWNERGNARAPWISRDGRAPPRGPTTPHSAQAARPGVSPLAATLKFARHPSFGAASLPAHSLATGLTSHAHFHTCPPGVRPLLAVVSP